jgi:hypothetical protein
MFEDGLPRISFAKIKKFKLELNIVSDWELERTHWAIKDVDLLQVLKKADVLDDASFNRLNGTVVVDPQVLKTYGTNDLIEFHEKTLSRVEADPGGAITGARSLLETVCKQILDRRSIKYETKEDLPKLYGKVARELRLAPSDHSEEAIKRILGGCFSVVEGLGALRNTMGDAHGHGLNPIKPDVCHARLAVHLATATAGYILEIDNNAV